MHPCTLSHTHAHLHTQVVVTLLRILHRDFTSFPPRIYTYALLLSLTCTHTHTHNSLLHRCVFITATPHHFLSTASWLYIVVHSCEWCVFFISVMWLTHTCDVSRTPSSHCAAAAAVVPAALSPASLEAGDNVHSSICEPWLIGACNVSHSYACCDSYPCLSSFCCRRCCPESCFLWGCWWCT